MDVQLTDPYGSGPGKADWIWDDELNMHMPCCSGWVSTVPGQITKCGNGPLERSQIQEGRCSERKHIDPWVKLGRGR